MTHITILADTHSNHKQLKLTGGDLLLHVGDFSNLGTHDEIQSFLAWFDRQHYIHKVYIAGNHDLSYERNIPLKNKFLALYPHIHYLEDSGIVLEGIKIWGSPWSPAFCNWAFNLPRKSKYLQEKWNMIPDDTDILMTHTAPYGIFDPNYDGISVGCELLREAIIDIAPRVHCFGHLHSGYDIAETCFGKGNTLFINASICNDYNQVVNKPIDINY